MIKHRLSAIESRPAEGEGRRRDFVFYSGEEIRRYDWWNDEEYTIQFSLKPGDFSLAKLERAPLLKDHNPMVEYTVGHVESPRVEKGVAMATAVFADTPDVADLWEKIEAGHVTDVSMGVEIESLELVSKPKEKKRYMALGWKPYEISVVPIGAAESAAFLSGGVTEEIPSEVRAFLRDLYQQHLAKTGAAGTADQQAAFRLRLALARQRQYELSV